MGWGVRFSERYGFKSVREVIQVDSMDDALRSGVWSIIKMHVWDHVERPKYGYNLVDGHNHYVVDLLKKLWLNYFKYPLDTLGDSWATVQPGLRKHFFGCQWYEVYDFVEFIATAYARRGFKEPFIADCNSLFAREVSAYRFVDDIVVRITTDAEIQAIERALDEAEGGVRIHLQRSLELLSSRSAPDYRNSIKESISAVESLVAIVLGAKGTLGQLLKKMEEDKGLHTALKSAFSNLYGYTSDEGGIRHALLEKESVDYEEAIFFNVVCSAFISYVYGKGWGVPQR